MNKNINNKHRMNEKQCGRKKKKIGQMGPAVCDFVRTSRRWCVSTADGEMFGDDGVPVANTAG